MIKIKYSLLFIALLSLSYSCNKWLDVKPSQQLNEEVMFSTEDGFKNALTGVYVKMKNAYEQHLIMTTVEYLAQNWITADDNLSQIRDFEYDADYVKNSMKSIYSNLYGVIVQANKVLDNLDAQGDEVINDENSRNIIRGEALALRAFCHFDVMRLFGQVPTSDATIKVDLPYSFTASKDGPAKYAHQEFINNLLKDVSEAASLLKISDPILNYSFAELGNSNNIGNEKIDSDFVMFRNLRLNYFAVKQLEARILLWAGQNDKAHQAAMEVINAQIDNADRASHGMSVVKLAGLEDFTNEYYTLPSETLFQFDVYDLGNISQRLFEADENILSATTDNTEILSEIFSNITTHNRYELWFTMSDASGVKYNSIKKYFQPEEENAEHTKNNVIPLLRLSEAYLIAIESASNVTVANELFKTYFAARNVIAPEYTTMEELREEVVREYRREFYAEGHMFFTYKRTNSETMLFRSGNIEEKNYVVPIPQTVVD